MVLQIPEITRLYQTHGAARYGAEKVTQLQHALQCAQLAEKSGADPALIVAALLHDLGHMLASYKEALPADAEDAHEYVAIPFLRGQFPQSVTEPIRLHNEAKRYICAMDRSCLEALSPASRRSLTLRGGPFSASEATLFIRQPFATESVLLRRWDDLAIDPSVRTPGWSHFLRYLERASKPASLQAA